MQLLCRFCLDRTRGGYSLLLLMVCAPVEASIHDSFCCYNLLPPSPTQIACNIVFSVEATISGAAEVPGVLRRFPAFVVSCKPLTHESVFINSLCTVTYSIGLTKSFVLGLGPMPIPVRFKGSPGDNVQYIVNSQRGWLLGSTELRHQFGARARTNFMKDRLHLISDGACTRSTAPRNVVVCRAGDEQCRDLALGRSQNGELGLVQSRDRAH